jgi:uncharacterized repeat protein (TIGR03806 family)
MNKTYSTLICLLILFSFWSCSKDDEYTPIPTSNPIPEATVSVDLTKVPYAKLSDYHFFEGNLKEQKPLKNVLPYEPASSLFADYAHKKRFVWMPKNTKATYNGDDNVFELPVGSVLIKSFYYDNVLPNNNRKIIETRLLIRQSDSWKAYDYIWNSEQTEANLDINENGVFVPVSWNENGTIKNVNYKIPSQTECRTCHKINPTGALNGLITIPIGIKPQNLNNIYNYDGTTTNQIAKWKSMGYLGNDVPNSIVSTVNWEDTSKSLELRARSYIDINCAHCHRQGGHCDYTAMRFNFSNTNLSTFGVCMTPSAFIANGPFVFNGGNANLSEAIIRLSSNEGSVKMPIIGRASVHEEGVQLIKDWVNSLPADCR